MSCFLEIYGGFVFVLVFIDMQIVTASMRVKLWDPEEIFPFLWVEGSALWLVETFSKNGSKTGRKEKLRK